MQVLLHHVHYGSHLYKVHFLFPHECIFVVYMNGDIHRESRNVRFGHGVVPQVPSFDPPKYVGTM